MVRDCDKKGVIEIAQKVGVAGRRARAARPAEMSGGCFSISRWAASAVPRPPIVNAPEVAILGVSKSAMQPVWDGKQFVPRLILPLSLSYDHRVIEAPPPRALRLPGALLGDMRRAML